MIELIPAIDIINGRCVRLTKGDYSSKKEYEVSPVDVAKQIEELGFKRLHVVDLDGAKSQNVVNIAVLNNIAHSTNLKIDFGGGIKTSEDLKKVFDNGASYATIGSVAVLNPMIFDNWIDDYSADRFILGADVNEGHICINGWKDESKLELLPFIEKYYRKGLKNVLCTDIKRDGMLQGTSVPLYKQIMKKFPDLNLIASGGVSSERDIAILEDNDIPAVVFGKAIYEGYVSLKQLAEKYLN